jgi:3-phenylpropionate/trans-cinnamate dioxygenase ferredoxin subunit
MSDGFVRVASVGEIPEGGLKEVRLDDRSIAIFHLEDGYYAIEDVCTHDGGPLAEGIREGDVIECPRHGARFDLKTGAVLSLPAVTPVPTFQVRVAGDEIQIQWPPEAATASAPAVRAESSPAQASKPAEPLSAAIAETPLSPAIAETQPQKTVETAGQAPSQQEMAVRSALETVMDPEIGLSVIDLGLIRTVDIQPGRTRVDMLLTTPFCPYAPQMIADVKQAAQSVLPQECDVEILPDAWSPDMMPDPSLLGFSY